MIERVVTRLAQFARTPHRPIRMRESVRHEPRLGSSLRSSGTSMVRRRAAARATASARRHDAAQVAHDRIGILLLRRAGSLLARTCPLSSCDDRHDRERPCHSNDAHTSLTHTLSVHPVLLSRAISPVAAPRAFRPIPHSAARSCRYRRTRSVACRTTGDC
jgi:hypothetical protein